MTNQEYLDLFWEIDVALNQFRIDGLGARIKKEEGKYFVLVWKRIGSIDWCARLLLGSVKDGFVSSADWDAQLAHLCKSIETIQNI